MLHRIGLKLYVMFYYNMHQHQIHKLHILVATGIQKTLLQQCRISNPTERTSRKKQTSKNKLYIMQLSMDI